jgi:hypothetical protein
MNYAATHTLEIYVCKPVHRTPQVQDRLFQDPLSILRRANEIHGLQVFILDDGSLSPAGFITLPPQSATPSSTAAPQLSLWTMAAAPAQPPMAAALASRQPLPAALVHRLKAAGQQHLGYLYITRRSPHALHRAAQALRQVAYAERYIKPDSATSINRFNCGSVRFQKSVRSVQERYSHRI